MQHTERLEFPNGMGYTPCTEEYKDAFDARKDICDANEGESIHDLSPALYQEWCTLDNKLMGLQLDGHLGKSVRY